MFDFTVRAKSGFWVLQDAECGELGAYETHDEALAAAGDWLRLIEQPWPVLTCDADGEWPATARSSSARAEALSFKTQRTQKGDRPAFRGLLRFLAVPLEGAASRPARRYISLKY